jgi:hypothetical protein
MAVGYCVARYQGRVRWVCGQHWSFARAWPMYVDLACVRSAYVHPVCAEWVMLPFVCL